jgi:hypothetical protein
MTTSISSPEKVMTHQTTEITKMGTARTFWTVVTCSETLINVLDRAFGHPMVPEEHAAAPLAGGLVVQGSQCGQLWGASLAAGAEAYRQFRGGPVAEAAAIVAVRRLVESFREMNRETNCIDLTHADWHKKGQVAMYLIKGGPITCTRMAVRYAPVCLRVIQDTFAEDPPEVPSGCVSCAAMTARRMGASEQHAVMAAGLAGGLGLSGGGCGALGAAVWITAMNNPDFKLGLSYDNTPIGAMVRTFVEASDRRFQCSEIAGRKFEDVNDHAHHLRDGGCAALIEALGTSSSQA